MTIGLSSNLSRIFLFVIGNLFFLFSMEGERKVLSNMYFEIQSSKRII